MIAITYFWIIAVGLLILLLLVANLRRIVILEHERGLLYLNGKFKRTLQPGQHWYAPRLHIVQKVDVRARFVSIIGQELLTADHVSIKISLAANYKIEDPYLAITQIANYQEALYLHLQLHLRDLVGATAVDDLLLKRKEIGDLLLENTKDKAAEIGLALLSVGIKDIMFPGELKNIFAQVVNARKEGLAALERARGESAALRNLANTAKLLENNPALLQLRLLQAVGGGTGNTIVLKLPEDGDGEIIPTPKSPSASVAQESGNVTK
jgi:regulator of protease activity HflC (stomatin/prohibitin superfamily)